LVFTPDGKFIVESNTNVPFFYWRSSEQGKVVHQGEFTSLSQIKPGDCNGGGQILLVNANYNTALIADYSNLLGPRTNNVVVISQLDLETGMCMKLFSYRGTFHLFDLNSAGNLLAYGGEGEDDSTFIWDVEKQEKVCSIPKVAFGRFVPGTNTLAVIREQKIVFIDATTCQELRELNVSPLTGYENYLAFTPDGKQLAVAKNSIWIVDVSTGEALVKFPYPQDAVPISSKLFLSGFRFSPDGHYLLVAYNSLNRSDQGLVQLWQLNPQ
jgi:WD40 repeat protein